MNHQPSIEDREFRRAFEAFEIEAKNFDHESHVRLAYVYLCDSNATGALEQMRQALLAFLTHLGIGNTKFHETITGAWIDAVNHFMVRSEQCSSFSVFIGKNPVLLDSKIMLSHYSAELLFSDEARARYIEPDVSPIPKH